MNISAPFIRRPIGTALFSLGLFLVGALAYWALPVASLPSVDFPTIRISGGRPGADPETMAATVAAPIERRVGEIAGVTELTSTNSLGSATVIAQFDLSRRVDSAARDVQAALNAAASDLPADLPSLPIFRKLNPAASPVLILALTSDTMPGSAIYDVADTVIAQRISQVEGVGEVSVSGAEQPAVRVRVDHKRLAAMGLSPADVRTAIVAANVQSPLGAFEGGRQVETIGLNDQLSDPAAFGRLVVAVRGGRPVRLSDVATVEAGVRNRRSAGWFNTEPAVLLVVTKQADANVIETVDRVKALLPELRRWIPAGIRISTLSDRTLTIRASVADMQWTLLVTIGLVMAVVLVFLRRATPTLAAGVTIPLSLAGTFAAMWAAGFTLDNLSLMAVTISVGFVVDDAIVMIENVYRHIEAGMDRFEAALLGARQIGFTVVSISFSLIAAFIPLLFMGGIVGRILQEFSLTLTFAILVSTFVSLTVAPAICAHRRDRERGGPGRFGRLVEGALAATVRGYAWTLSRVLRHPWMTLAVFFGVLALTVQLFREAPKGLFPQDDSGLIFGLTEASADVSYPEMVRLQREATRLVLADPAVGGTGSFVGGGSMNQGRLFISLKPSAERGDGGITTQRVIGRLRANLSHLPGMRVYMFPALDLRTGARQGKGQFQYTIWSPDIADLRTYTPRIVERMRGVREIVDVATDREQGGLQADVRIDRTAASRLGVSIQSIDEVLNDAFAQRQISTIYSARNQYRVILEVPPRSGVGPEDLERIHVPAADGTQVPLSSVARIGRSSAPLVVNHQGQFPSVTITYNLAEGATLDAAAKAIDGALAEIHLPASLHGEPAGDAKAFQQSAGAQGLLVLAALVAVYIILGVLYESLIHPLTIISTLPPAGLGALVALRFAGLELTVIALIGIILLIGIVKKNGIMLVDFAIQAERERGLAPAEAIYAASLERFRPILMTTMAALLGAVPLAVATGAGAELRRPLGVAIVGGLMLSQVLTLYTTPVIYLLLDRLRRRRTLEDEHGDLPAGGGLGVAPAE